VANHKSAIKAHRQNLKHRERNRQERTRLRTALKSIRASIDAGDTNSAQGVLRDTVSLIDKMASKKIIHSNTAGRYKSRMVKQIAKLSASA
jgi:small subunit ribosomal protein S20|tara:strand:+ start:486 stop:758 length:273 start_codon:yes stop_codon:yes gene_type:complete